MTAPAKTEVDECVAAFDYACEVCGSHQDEGVEISRKIAPKLSKILRAHKAIMEAKRPEPVRVYVRDEVGYVTHHDYKYLLAAYDRVAAERDAANDEIVRLNTWADSFTDSHLKERKTGDALVKEVLQRAETAERQLAELQRKHDGLVKRLREPDDDMQDAAAVVDGKARMVDGREEGATYAALFKAMSAVALDKGGE